MRTALAVPEDAGQVERIGKWPRSHTYLLDPIKGAFVFSSRLAFNQALTRLLTQEAAYL